jgi:alpha-galactosidase
MENTIAEYEISEMRLVLVRGRSGTVGLELMPAGFGYQTPYAAESCVEAHVDGDMVNGGFGNGHTMRNSASSTSLRYDRHEFTGATLVIFMSGEKGRYARTTLELKPGEKALRVNTVYGNLGEEAILLEMLSSFSLGGIIPSEGSLLHRFRSKWSAEGRLVSEDLSDLQLDPSWAKHCVRSEKFGQTGSLPVRNFFPCMALEDRKNHVTWGTALACASSWQMEVYRRDDALSLSGGLGDYEFAHWRKTLAPGAEFAAPEAYITVCRGGVDDACARLVSVQKPFAGEMPIVYNEYFTTYGAPTEESADKALRALGGHDLDVFVIDAGWYGISTGWSRTQGDWDVNVERFPNGMKVVTDRIRAHGLLPGLWFELEVCGPDSRAYTMTDHLLKRNGKVIEVGERRFWDLRDPWTRDYLKRSVIGSLKDHGFGYVKIDYNDSIGVGCDGAESLGEGLRQNMLAARDFFRLIAAEIPGIIIENCASGGHRLEPSFMELCGTASFSDAHETEDIPIIAANLHRLIQPSKSQIWAVVRKGDDLKRVRYSMTNIMLGMACFSGVLDELSAAQWAVIDAAFAFYRKATPVIREGSSRIYADYGKNTLHPSGRQAVVRTGADGMGILAVFHAFRGAGGSRFDVPVPDGYRITDVLSGADDRFETTSGALTAVLQDDMSAAAVLLRRG